MKVLAYLLYGAQPEYRAELTFSVLSALRLLGDQDEVKIVVLTDQPLSGLPVETMALTADEMQLWTHHGAYSHRAKLPALLKVMNTYSAATVLIDTDTYFKDDPRKLFERIGPRHSLMHTSDGYTLGTAEEWQPVLASGIARPDTEMLNSGVIGVDPSDAALVEQAIERMDRIRAVAPIFNAEQVAVSIGLKSGSEVGLCADVVAHYWGYLRPFLHLEIERFLAANQGKAAAELIAGSASVRVELPDKRLLDRVLAKVLTRWRRWSPGYGFAFLCYRTGLAYAARDPEVATLWITSALHALQHCGAGAGEVRRDFGAVDRASWLSPKVAQEWRLWVAE